jgi:hypothetical protein
MVDKPLHFPRSTDNGVIVEAPTCEGVPMDWQTPVNIPESLRYGDGLYIFERFSRAGAGGAQVGKTADNLRPCLSRRR